MGDGEREIDSSRHCACAARENERAAGGAALGPKVCWLAWLVLAAVSPPLGTPAGQDPPQAGEVIVITQEDLEAFARAQKTSPSVSAEAPAGTRADQGLPIRLSDCYKFPFRECIYWHWLETGALSAAAEAESLLSDRWDKYRKLRRARQWSEQLQRELDRIEDEIERLEREREQALLERAAQMALSPGLSPSEKTEAAVIHMALGQIYLDDGRAKKAIEAFDEARRYLGDEPLVDTLRGVALREVGRIDEARRALEAALNRRPRLVLALITLAKVLEDDLEYGEAARLWERASRATLSFPHGLKRWAERNRDRLPDGEAGLARLWTNYLGMRLRLARLRDFAHRYYQSYEKANYKMIFDPSIGAALDERRADGLRDLVERYMDGGDPAADSSEIERLLGGLARERDSETFRRLMAAVSNSLATAERDISAAIGHRPRSQPVVVLYNPVVWEALTADRWVLGLYRPYGRSISIYLEPMTSKRSLEELKNTIYHEYAHFVTYDLTGPRRMPLWLSEGLAEWLALESGYDRFGDDPVLARWSRIWATDRIERSWFSKGDDAFRMADYYKARRAVGLLATRFGSRALRAMLEALGEGADLDEASQAAFGIGYRELQRFLVKRLPSWTGP